MAQEQHAPPPGGSAAWGFLRFLIELLIGAFFLGAFFMALNNVFGVSIEIDRAVSRVRGPRAGLADEEHRRPCVYSSPRPRPN
jgi:hypothetical protein